MPRNEPNRIRDTPTLIRTTEDDKEAIRSLADTIGVSVSSLVVMLVRDEYARRKLKLPKAKK